MIKKKNHIVPLVEDFEEPGDAEWKSGFSENFCKLLFY